MQNTANLNIEKAKLITFFEQSPTKFYSLRYIEICTQIDTAILKLLLENWRDRRLKLEHIEGNYRAIPTHRKLSPKQKAQRELSKLREKATNHAIARGVPKIKARLAAMNAFCDLD